MKKLKVVWLCHLSNAKLRETAQLKMGVFEKIVRKIAGRPTNFVGVDFAEWNTRALKLMNELHPEIEIHVVSPMRHLLKKRKVFQLDSIFYHLYRPSSDSFFQIARSRILRSSINYKDVTVPAVNFINEINPDIVQLVGLENPYYSSAALELDLDKYPTIGVLQTLMSDPDFKKSYKIKEDEYVLRTAIEEQLIKKLPYIASGVERYTNICKRINPNLKILKGMLAVALDMDESVVQKEYDFVFFAKSISKCGDDAIKAFARVHKYNPSYRLCMIGGYSSSLLKEYKQIAYELGCLENIDFRGIQPTHDGVLAIVKRSKVAILPLRFDAVSGTVREAMAMGVPVVSNITSGTPELNIDRESILLSVPGDYESMSKDMIRLIEDDALSATIVKNARKTYEERYSNLRVIDNMVKAYEKILK